ncbi:unnamed protein product [Paramecium sonneborni]|uniref:Uncharacterized protein n=1 Tax=Paramecium sonneborni TaxID=65129 RepID=A0A8S1LAP6_9CILI|nr:unnamed protein product [Paramecium sonneborni]
MKRQISKREQTIKCEIFQNKMSKSKSFMILQIPDENFDQQKRMQRRMSCYSLFFGYLNKFQIQHHNIAPEFKTKYSTQDKEIKETNRRKTQIAEDTVIKRFRRGVQEITKCKTVIQTLKMLQKKNKNIQDFINQIKTPKDSVLLKKTRRNSCYCSECGQQSQFQQKHQNDPFFNFFNYNEFLKRQIIKIAPKFQNKLFSLQQENLQRSYVLENKSLIYKYKTVSKTTNLLIKLSQQKLPKQSIIPSQRVKTELTQCSQKSFKFQLKKNAQIRSRNQLNLYSMTTNQTKDSFRSLASIYK